LRRGGGFSKDARLPPDKALGRGRARGNTGPEAARERGGERRCRHSNTESALSAEPVSDGKTAPRKSAASRRGLFRPGIFRAAAGGF
jgi:hypothetical protein